jgi:hypothetical protein
MLDGPVAIGIAWGFAFATVAISVFQVKLREGGVAYRGRRPRSLTCSAHPLSPSIALQICMHLRNYTEPSFQRYIIRIIFLASPMHPLAPPTRPCTKLKMPSPIRPLSAQVPFYAIASCLALHYRHNSIYYETPRDCYEAWVVSMLAWSTRPCPPPPPPAPSSSPQSTPHEQIYNFMALCMAYIGGPGAVVVKCEGKTIPPSWILCTCCWPPIPVDGFFLRKCKQGTLQFVIIKPILAFATLGLWVEGLYTVSDYGFNNG